MRVMRLTLVELRELVAEPIRHGIALAVDQVLRDAAETESSAAVRARLNDIRHDIAERLLRDAKG